MQTNRRPVHPDDPDREVTEDPFEYTYAVSIEVPEGLPFTHAVFTDPDGDPLTCTATDGSPLPGGLVLEIDTGTCTLSGPALTMGEEIVVKVTATDTPQEDSPALSASVTLRVIANQPGDPPSEPWVSIKLGSSSTEGNPVTFTLTRGNDNIAQTRTVNVSVIETGDMLSGTPPTSVEFAANSATATLEVQTVDDDMVEDDSEITATITVPAGFQIFGSALATATVMDNDDTPVDDDTVMCNASSPAVSGFAAPLDGLIEDCTTLLGLKDELKGDEWGAELGRGYLNVLVARHYRRRDPIAGDQSEPPQQKPERQDPRSIEPTDQPDSARPQ